MLGIRIFTFSLATAAAVGCLAQPVNYFPLDVGNQWVYQVSGLAGGSSVVAGITGVVEGNGRYWAIYEGFEGARWLRVDEAGSLYAYDPQARLEVAVAPFGNDQATFEPQPNPCRQTGRIVSRAAAYKGPIGEFTNALEVRYSPGACNDAGLISEVYLPWVGLVQRTVSTIAGPRVYDLTYARLGDVTVITGPEVSFGMALNPSPLAPGDTLRVRLSLRVARSTPLRLTFPSGQLFDLAIRNSKGEQVYLWSAGKAFTMAIVNMEVQGEKNFLIEAPLAGIPPGRYTVETWLTTVGPREWAAVMPIEIR